MDITARRRLANQIIAEHLRAHEAEDAPALQATLLRSQQLLPATSGLPYFAYGSQMWLPCFQRGAPIRASLPDYLRDYCIVSTHYRGNDQQPGLVLGVRPEPGAVVHGLCFTLTETDLIPLLQQEMLTGVYVPTWVAVQTDTGELQALTFVACPGHERVVIQPPAVQAQMIVRARGQRGPNLEYFLNTQAILRELRIDDPVLDELEAEIRRHLPAAD